MNEKKVIEYEDSTLKSAQILTNKLAIKLGRPTYKWQNLEDNVSLAESIQDLANALKELSKYYKSETCDTHNTGYRSDNVTTYNGCSTNKSSVRADVCSNYDFKGSCDYDAGCTTR